jgi:two-component sensor histidine kinase
MSDSVRILYIEDDAGLGRLIQKALQPHGIIVRHIESGDEGVRLLQSEPFDAVALDHNLTNETGLDVMARIQNIGIDVPMIYVTGSDDARIAVAALKAGAVDYVWKDVQGHYRELLGQSVRAALAQQRLRREAEAAQKAIRDARDRAELLLAEVNHRVANSLALVASLARLQSNASDNAAVRHAMQEMEARIMAVAGVHRRLYTSSDVRYVEMGTYLAALVEDLRGALNESGQKRVIMLAAEAGIRMPTDKAVSLGVIMTELVTNAYKYAYATDQRGEIRVSLQRTAPDHMCLVVADDGVGWTGVGDAKGSGLGTRVISAMAGNLRSALTYDPAHRGTRASIDVKIDVER